MQIESALVFSRFLQTKGRQNLPTSPRSSSKPNAFRFSNLPPLAALSPSLVARSASLSDVSSRPPRVASSTPNHAIAFEKVNCVTCLVRQCGHERRRGFVFTQSGSKIRATNSNVAITSSRQCLTDHEFLHERLAASLDKPIETTRQASQLGDKLHSSATSLVVAGYPKKWLERFFEGPVLVSLPSACKDVNPTLDNGRACLIVFVWQ